MAWPSTAVSTANLDSGSDSPASARADILEAVQAVNSMMTNPLPSAQGGVPPGVILAFAGTAEPSGWVMCYGQALSRTGEAAELFAKIGTTFGSGDGSTTFNVPDMRGRVAAGVDNMGGTTAGRVTSGGSGVAGNTLGAAGGSEVHTLTTAQIPAHTHGMSQAMPAITNGAGGVNRASSNTADKLSGTSDSTGGGGAHNNVQPTIMLNYIIKL